MQIENLNGRNRYVPLDDMQFADIVEGLREATESVVELDDKQRVERLLARVEQAVDVVLVERNISIASERGTSFEGGPRRAGAADRNF